MFIFIYDISNILNEILSNEKNENIESIFLNNQTYQHILAFINSFLLLNLKIQLYLCSVII